ncbi:MAG: cupredoxin domain-containing protein [Ilumatobacteraceae bacterium]
MHISLRPVRSLAVMGAASALALAACGGSDAADPTTATTATTAVAAAATTGDVPAATAAAAPEVTAAPTGTDAGAAPASPNGDNTITIADFAFSGVTEVPVGTTIIVTNTDSSPHTFTSDDDLFDAGSLRQGDTFEFTFDTAGEFAYHCNFHESMTGTITVTG